MCELVPPLYLKTVLSFHLREVFENAVLKKGVAVVLIQVRYGRDEGVLGE